MKKLVIYLLASAVALALVACGGQPAPQTQPTEDTTAPSISQTQPDSVITAPSSAVTVPADTEPTETRPGMTMPEVGEDAGGFGPIF